MSAPDFEALLGALVRTGVQFIVVGGFAGTLQGSARFTQDLDIVYARNDANLQRLVDALAPLVPYLRGAPAGLPFRWDVETLRRGLNFTLTTPHGDLDVLGEITGGGAYEALYPDSFEVAPFGLRLRCLSLEKLIAVKRAAGRPKDFEAIAELELLRDVEDD